jgi:hypothetical protein
MPFFEVMQQYIIKYEQQIFLLDTLISKVFLCNLQS